MEEPITETAVHELSNRDRPCRCGSVRRFAVVTEALTRCCAGPIFWPNSRTRFESDGVTVGIPAPPAPEGVLRLVKLGILTEADTGNFAREQ
jgi:hypothetical protein